MTQFSAQPNPFSALENRQAGVAPHKLEAPACRRVLKVLIGGECNGRTRDAFIRRGHYAVSADFKETKVPGPHYRGNWLDIQDQGWDLAIFHRTCTFLAFSGSKHLYLTMKKEGGLNEERFLQMGRDAWEFWNHMRTCPIEHVAWENPMMIPYAHTMVGRRSQAVQPWWFGDDEDGPDNCKKETWLWLKKLPKLKRTGTLDGSTARADVHRMAPTQDPEDRRAARAVTYPGTADAFAEQWGDFVARKLGLLEPLPLFQAEG